MGRTIEEILGEVKLRDIRLPDIPPVQASTPLSEIYRRFAEQHRCAIVVCDGDEVVGIFTERDIIYRTILEGHDPSTPVSRVMTRNPKTVRRDACVSCAVRSMVSGNHRHMALLDEAGRPIGLVSVRDILQFIADHFPPVVINLPPDLHQAMLRCEGA